MFFSAHTRDAQQVPMNLSVDPHPFAKDRAAILNGLSVLGKRVSSPRNYQEFAIALKTEDGVVVGGVIGVVTWMWLHINAWWVVQEYCRQQHGQSLLMQAEVRGRVLGCMNIRLDTFDFEPNGFYLKEG